MRKGIFHPGGGRARRSGQGDGRGQRAEEGWPRSRRCWGSAGPALRAWMSACTAASTLREEGSSLLNMRGNAVGQLRPGLRVSTRNWAQVCCTLHAWVTRQVQPQKDSGSAVAAGVHKGPYLSRLLSPRPLLPKRGKLEKQVISRFKKAVQHTKCEVHHLHRLSAHSSVALGIVRAPLARLSRTSPLVKSLPFSFLVTPRYFWFPRVLTTRGTSFKRNTFL